MLYFERRPFEMTLDYTFITAKKLGFRVSLIFIGIQRVVTSLKKEWN
jgi:hypothetical protein